MLKVNWIHFSGTHYRTLIRLFAFGGVSEKNKKMQSIICLNVQKMLQFSKALKYFFYMIKNYWVASLDTDYIVTVLWNSVESSVNFVDLLNDLRVENVPLEQRLQDFCV